MTAQPSIVRTPTPSSEDDFDFDAFEREVMKQADALTPELLPRLLLQLLKRDSLVFCERHMQLLFPYVRAQIALTRARRNYYRWSDIHWPSPCHAGTVIESMPETNLRMATIARDNARQAYRSKPCVCFKQHR